MERKKCLNCGKVHTIGAYICDNCGSVSFEPFIEDEKPVKESKKPTKEKAKEVAEEVVEETIEETTEEIAEEKPKKKSSKKEDKE